MTTTTENVYFPEVGPPRRWNFGWVLPGLYRPREVFRQIMAQERGLASTPLLLLVLVSLASALIAGSIKEAAAAGGQVVLPPGFEYYTPEQQAQLQQAMAATSGPVFLYVMPSFLAVLGVFTWWLAAGLFLHLLFTLMGGRGSSQQTLNVVAWASLPFVLRHLVRIMAMLANEQLIAHPGLSGFISGETGTASVFAAALLALVDLYLVWHVALMIQGVRSGENLAAAKVWTAVLFTVVVLLLLRTAPALVAAQFSDLTIIRPFF